MLPNECTRNRLDASSYSILNQGFLGPFSGLKSSFSAGTSTWIVTGADFPPCDARSRRASDQLNVTVHCGGDEGSYFFERTPAMCSGCNSLATCLILTRSILSFVYDRITLGCSTLAPAAPE